jgi:CRISPR-associated protein Csb2
VWPAATPDATLLRLLADMAEHVTYLGSSRSPVRVRLCESPEEPTWVPDDAGTVMLRVAGRGRLERLEWSFQNGLRPSPGAFQGYCPVSKRQAPEAPATSVFGEMVVFRLDGPTRPEIETTLKLTDALRAAVMSLAGEGDVPVPDILSGHGAHPHMAYLALPFVSEEQPHADGHVLGLATVLPRQMDPDHRRQALRALAKLQQLQVPGMGHFSLERLTAQSRQPAVNLRQATWVGPSTCWTSSTPVLLERFPKKNLPAEEIIARGCEFVGLPQPKTIQVHRFSPLFGAEPSGRFLKVRRPGEPARLSTHVTLTFDRPVLGPLLLGAGRYFGLGLLRPCRRQLPQEEPQ